MKKNNKHFIRDKVFLDMPFEDTCFYTPDELYDNFNTLKKYIKSYIKEHIDYKDFVIYFDLDASDGDVIPYLHLQFERPATAEEIKLEDEDKKTAKQKIEQYEREQYLRLKEKFDGK